MPPLQVLPVQLMPIGQTMPHPPQLLESKFVLTQFPSHFVKPEGQLATHIPPLHTCPKQLLPQAPQFLLSNMVFAQYEYGPIWHMVALTGQGSQILS
jgi:hypothetical protein